jgi:uncharacterized protein YlxW (UPF0749 family)
VVNADLRSQALQSAKHADAGSSSIAHSSSMAAAAAADLQLSSVHIQSLQQQIAAQASEIQGLQKELAGLQGFAGSSSSSSAGSNGLPCQPTAATAASEGLGLNAAASIAAGALDINSSKKTPVEDSAAAAAHMALLKQHEELQAYVQQLEGQAMQREALLGELLAQVRLVLSHNVHS